MDSLLQKLRSLLEASWAVSPTLVGLACIALDLAALVHLRLKKPQLVQAVGERHPGK